MEGYKRIKCGDTKSCEHCRVSNDNMTVECLVQNELGRCDLYRGPDHKLYKMVTEGGQTRAIQIPVAS